MAEYRTLHTKFWQDEWVCELDPDGKLLFVYLVTNRAASLAGIYKLPDKFIAFETGIAPERVGQLMAAFQQAGKVYHEDGVIWVVKLRSYQTYNGKASEQVEKRIAKDLADIPDCRLKREYIAYYSAGDTPYIPYAGGIGGSQIPTPETETDIKTDTDTETDNNNGAEVPAPLPSAPLETPEPEHEPDPAGPLSVGQREFLKAFGAKRFKTNVQREAVLELEKKYGTGKLQECVTWAAKRGMGLGEAVGAIEKAIVKWGEAKAPKNGAMASAEPKGMAAVRSYAEKRGIKVNGN